MDRDATRARVLLPTALAAAANLVLDVLTSRVPWITPPYLLLDHASEAFRDLLMLDRTTVMVVVAIVTAGVNGAIAGLFGAALASVPRRRLKLALSLSGLWVFSGGLMMLVYLSPPLGIALGSLATGVPRAFAIAWLLDRALPREAPAGN